MTPGTIALMLVLAIYLVLPLVIWHMTTRVNTLDRNFIFEVERVRAEVAEVANVAKLLIQIPTDTQARIARLETEILDLQVKWNALHPRG